MASERVEPKAPTRQLKYEDEFLQYFWTLVETKDEAREAAAKDLICFIEGKQNRIKQNGELCGELEYSVKRLVKGLASSRKCARQGFATALTGLMRRFKEVTIELVLRKVKKKLKVSKNDTKEEQTNTYLGQAFAYLAIVQSDQIIKASDEALMAVTNGLLGVGKERSYMQQMCILGLIGLASKVPSNPFRKHVWPILKEELTGGWHSCTPNTLLLAFGVLKYQKSSMNKDFLTEHWKTPTLLSENTLPHVVKVVKASTNDHPIVHDVCYEILEEAKRCKLLPQVWRTVVNDNLCTKESNDARKYLTFQLAPTGLRLASTADMVSIVLSKSVIENLMYYLQHPARVLHSAGQQLLKAIQSYAESCTDGKLQLAVLTSILSPPGHINFDAMTNTKAVSTISNVLVLDAVKEYGDKLIQIIWGESHFGETTKNNVNVKRKWAISQLANLITVKSCNQEWQLYVLTFFFIHAFFEIDKFKGTVSVLEGYGNWCEKPLTKDVQHSLQEAFYKALNNLGTFSHSSAKANHRDKFTVYIDVLYEMFLYADKCLQKNVPLICPLSKEARTAFKTMLGVVQKIKAKDTKDKKMSENHAFELLFLHLGLKLFADSKSAVEALAELHVCYDKASQRKRRPSTKKGEDEEPSWIEVVTELLLSLLSQPSNLVRKVTNDVFSSLVPHLNSGALQLILDVFKPPEDDDGPLTFEDEGDEDDLEPVDLNSENKQNSQDNDNDDASSSSSDSSDEDDDNHDVDESFRQSLEAALGDAAVKDEEESDSDLDDEAMFRLDGAIAEVFKMQTKGKISKIEKEKNKQLVHFKVRCLDLLDILVTNIVPASMKLDCVLPLLDIIEAGVRDKEQKVLSDKATTVYRHLCSSKNQKKITVESIVDINTAPQIIEDLLQYSTKVSGIPIIIEVAQGILFVLKVLSFGEAVAPEPSPVKTRLRKSSTLAKESDPIESQTVNKVVELLKNAVLEYFGRRDSHYNHMLFHTLVERQPATLWPLTEPLLDNATKPDNKVYAKTQAYSMLSAMITKDAMHRVDNHVLLTFVKEAMSKVSKDICQLNNIELKPRYTQDLLLFLHRLMMVDTTQKLNADVVKKLGELLPYLQKDSKKLCKGLLKEKNESSFGSNKNKKHKPKHKLQSETNETDLSSPSKKSKNEGKLNGDSEFQENSSKKEKKIKTPKSKKNKGANVTNSKDVELALMEIDVKTPKSKSDKNVDVIQTRGGKKGKKHKGDHSFTSIKIKSEVQVNGGLVSSDCDSKLVLSGTHRSPKKRNIAETAETDSSSPAKSKIPKADGKSSTKKKKKV